MHGGTLARIRKTLLGTAAGGALSATLMACYGVAVECETDADNDGYCAELDDCNDNDADINPGATELAGDDIDSNCDGENEPVDAIDAGMTDMDAGMGDMVDSGM